jgi:hypothetical protein
MRRPDHDDEPVTDPDLFQGSLDPEFEEKYPAEEEP